jgi:hypothetical protein
VSWLFLDEQKNDKAQIAMREKSFHHMVSMVGVVMTVAVSFVRVTAVAMSSHAAVSGMKVKNLKEMVFHRYSLIRYI